MLITGATAMAKITKARAYANNEVAFIAWQLDGMINDCLGFDIVRIRPDGAEPDKGLPTWVAFPGQKNPDWIPQDTGVWPVQKLWWRDLTLRQHRADTGRRDSGFQVKYSIRPVGKAAPGRAPVPVRQAKHYDGNAIPLGYLGPARETNTILIDANFDGVRATFTNGILAAQWLERALEAAGKPFTKDSIRKEIKDPKSDIRAYLTGDVLETVTLFLTDKAFDDGSIKFALYELSDKQLVDLLIANKNRVEVILSNSSKDRGGVVWDTTNRDARGRLKKEHVPLHDRMFNNGHIGHNKFAVWSDKHGTPRAVMTGSTNWTSTGLCGQANNALIVESDDAAKAYAEYWQRLLDDKFPNPKPITSAGGGPQKQGKNIRTDNQTPAQLQLKKPDDLILWYSPNTDRTSKGTDTPPDLEMLFDLMRHAEDAIFFLAFLPSRAGANSIIQTAIDCGLTGKKPLVVGAISDPTAMPGYVAPDKNGATEAQREGRRQFMFDKDRVHVTLAEALNDTVGDFERECLKVGNAIIHDKVVVIDPLSSKCVVATGSHNLGFKASYENDENLMILRGNQALAQAYAVHALDVYDHYRFRAWQAKEHAEGKPTFSGKLNKDDKWLRDYASGKKGDIARYFL